MTTSERRYPGSRPFQDTPLDRLLFRGREAEKKALLHLILAEDTVLLYAKSGMGKTSLLNAGILQQLREREFYPFVVRINQPRPALAQTLCRQVESQAREQGLDAEIEPASRSHLWSYFHALKLWQGDVLMTPVLIFDQFEELFTLIPDRPRREFLTQFACLARRTPPEGAGSKDGSSIPVKAPPLKMVLSIREDYLGELEQIATEAPQVMHHRFRLTSLTRDQARCAILEPAELAVEGVAGQRFDYAPAAVEELLEFLCARRLRTGTVAANEVEPFQLQILCQHLEEGVLERQQRGAGVVVVSSSDLGGRQGMEGILQQFYNRQINQIPVEERDAVRHLCERGLISETEKRLSLEEEEIERQFRVRKVVLDKMVELRLIRAEPRVGSVYYELSHDTLVAPILRDRLSRDPEAILRKAEGLRIAGAYAEAFEAYDRVLQLDGKYALGYVQYATLLMQIGRVDQAVEVASRAVDQGVENASLYQLLGDAYKMKYESERASDAERPPDGSEQTPERVQRLRPRRISIEIVIKAYKKAIAMDKNNPNAYQQLGLLYIGRGEPARALGVFRRAVEVDDEFAYILEELVKELKTRGAQDTVREMCLAALKTRAQNASLYFRIAYELGQLQVFARAAEACERSATLDPSEPATFNNWGYYLSQLARHEEAIAKYRAALDQDPKYGLAYRNWANDLWKLGRREEALKVYEQAALAVPDDHDTYVDWGWSLGEMDRQEEAIEKYRRAVELNPAYGGGFRNWADALWKLGRKEEALEVYAKGTQAAPDDAATYIDWGWSLGELDRYEESIDKYRKAAELRPDNAQTYNNWGAMLVELNRPEEAIERYRKAVECDPNYGRAYRNLADTLWKLDRKEEAVQSYEKAAAADPRDMATYSDWGWSLAKLERRSDALEVFRRALEIEPNNSEMYRLSADVLFDDARHEEAFADYQKAIDVDPENVNAFYNWGWSLLKLGRREEALVRFQRVLDLDPGFGRAWASSAEALAELGRTGEALELLAKAAASGPTEAEDFTNLGWGYFICGEYVQSIEWSRKALGVEVDSVTAQCNLALATLHLGNREEAEGQYREAIETAWRLKEPETLKENAIEDLEEVLAKKPDLAGGQEMLAMVRRAYEEMIKPAPSGTRA